MYQRLYQIGQLARLARISVRTLHYYDELGLVVPSGRSDGGYRLYTDADLARLQQVLLYRAVGLPLVEIGAILRDPAFDRRAALVEQRAKLVADAAHTRALIELVDRTLLSLDQGENMKPEDQFDGFDSHRYDDEVAQRWGQTAAFAESQRRTKKYDDTQWTVIRAEEAQIVRALGELLRAGVAATDERALDAAERHRLHIDRWFYPCGYAMHVGLGQMYLADERFAQRYEQEAPGLTEFVVDAITANAERNR